MISETSCILWEWHSLMEVQPPGVWCSQKQMKTSFTLNTFLSPSTRKSLPLGLHSGLWFTCFCCIPNIQQLSFESVADLQSAEPSPSQNLYDFHPFFSDLQILTVVVHQFEELSASDLLELATSTNFHLLLVFLMINLPHILLYLFALFPTYK